MFERYHPNEKFEDVKLRPGIIEATKKQLSSGKFEGKTIQLCFMCDPYSAGIDTTPTREIIKLIKAAGAHVQILTKGGDRARRDFDLLGGGDSFGISLSCINAATVEIYEPHAAVPLERIDTLVGAHLLNIKTWVSFEPVLEPEEVLKMISGIPEHVSVETLLKIGKLNHVTNYTDWKTFGLEAERICKENGWNYYIKEDLRKCTEGE
jgi:DNA repair photolyase